MLTELDVPVRKGDEGQWFRERPNVRPFGMMVGDIGSATGVDVGVQDPTRHMPTACNASTAGTPAKYMQASKDGSRYRQMVWEHGTPHGVTAHKALVFDASGGFGERAAEQFNEIFEEARKHGKSIDYRGSEHDHTWSALNARQYYSQLISFAIVRVTAVAIRAGIAAALAHQAN